MRFPTLLRVHEVDPTFFKFHLKIFTLLRDSAIDKKKITKPK